MVTLTPDEEPAAEEGGEEQAVEEGEEQAEQQQQYEDLGEDVDDVADTPNEKLLRTSRIDVMDQPESYRNNTHKEELMLQYVANFQRQFEDLYPKRRPLLLCPRNECGMRKFICTSVRPTQLPFEGIYNYEKCAAFVADFIRYEPLELPAALPQHMPSCTSVLEWQAGDCFDMAQVLCSLLLGVGYDAYVVSGYAPRAITHCDQSAANFPANDAGGAKQAEEEAAVPKYVVRPMRALESSLIKGKAQRKKDAAAAALKGDEGDGADVALIAAQEAEELDDLKGQRVHAWVLVLAGKRMLEASLFLEPSTGLAYAVEAAPYYGIEAVWSASNLWVNMQQDKAPAAMAYDLQNLHKWEHVMLDTLATPLDDMEAEDDDMTSAAEASAAAAAREAAATSKREAEEEANAAADEGREPRTFMEMPPSWVQRLTISVARFEARCPGSTKAVTYRKGSLQTFAPYSRADGLVQQLTIYSDAARINVLEVRQTFALRKDRLAARVRYTVSATGLPEDRTHEFYDPGRVRGEREHILIEGLRRELHFMPSARLDGLKLRVEEFGKKTTQYYDGSKDNLIYRSASYKIGAPAAADGGMPETSNLRKMTEKFQRDTEGKDAEEDVAKRVFGIAGSGEIKCIYHYGDDRVTASFRSYAKDGTDSVVVQVDPFSKPPPAAAQLEEFQLLQAAERDCINEVRDADRQSKDLLRKREEEEASIAETMTGGPVATGEKPLSKVPPHLLVSTYDTLRHKFAEQEETEEEKAQAKVPHDYLTPFLPQPIGLHDAPLSKEEAFHSRDGCLKALKERLVERANIVQSRLDEENAALSKRQAAFQRNRDHMDPNDEAEYERYCQEAMFRIQILEQRLDRHTELSLQKYAEMDARLRSDPRLAKLSHG